MKKIKNQKSKSKEQKQRVKMLIKNIKISFLIFSI